MASQSSERQGLTHDAALDLAIRSALTVVGRTSPNPPVGAVVVRDGVVRGIGATQPPGGPHAEVVALREAGEAARGAILYSTLEPCTFHARTPPCTAAIIGASIRAVFYVASDNDPRIGPGAGEVLRAAGIGVARLPDPGSTVAEMLAPFRCRIATGRPMVSVKYAMTLDGRIAAVGGDSRWVSGAEARHQVHLLRDRVDAIMVGVGTVISDDPELTTRLVDHWRPVRHPLRVVVDSRGRAPLGAKLFEPEMSARTLVATVAPDSGWVGALRDRGVEVEILPADSTGRVDLPVLLKLLAGRGVNHLLVEGGSGLLGGLNDCGLIDQIQAYVAPKLVGGATAPGPLAGLGVSRMAGARRFELQRIERHGDDVLLVAMATNQPWWESDSSGTEDGEIDVHWHS
ncbi:MAG: bifunctional diaminohydroxyphosphoribosylaminopyrimidine deaminase/5-amino-6-(5-phosphoribosylamino)uracil reductase RibD [Blastocatellia bacterium]